jgi:hypothetical protein
MAKAGVHEVVDNADVADENQHRRPSHAKHAMMTPACLRALGVAQNKMTTAGKAPKGAVALLRCPAAWPETS